MALHSILISTKMQRSNKEGFRTNPNKTNLSCSFMQFHAASSMKLYRDQHKSTARGKHSHSFAFEGEVNSQWRY